MGSNKGITLISLISSLVLMIILTSITIVTSVNGYNQMKFEGAKAEIEQIQKLVDEIATDYQTYLKEKDNTTETGYVNYFKNRYNATDFDSKLLTSHLEEAKAVVEKYPALKNDTSQMMFYFTSDDIVKYFDLKGINSVVVDFSTRTVYSVNGIKDPDDKTKIYYTPSEWGGKVTVDYSPASSSNINVDVTQIAKSEDSFDIELTVNKKIKISEIYSYKDGKYTKVNNFRVIEVKEPTSATDFGSIKVRFTITGSGNYKFKVVDELKNSYESTDKSIS